jgi:two-component system cell cycle sensor histidine kinase PleC
MPALRADERRIKQVLLNLLSNAVKFTPRDGQVWIDAGVRDDGRIFLTVTDTGPGLSAEDKAVALSPFGRTRSAVESAQEGTGLGLPLSKSLIEAHGGKFVIDSVPGEGCAVTATFPARRVGKAA